ncbi:hypothetical protein N7478_001485 [Penicillium angulare]|uniref:uncharacterized protein n=1 Tax=Penicillium angulare TaxID=116970 RepID=UPI002540A9F2|nr:uncharacterized protein N7478_010746 [Penicillium angulare]XP_056785580.1 uncharacterized protein N7478_001485 [Penicillium angulare]KAJ5267938.1 hypothetical protein N7478_010746 [Penicillium angulare]KAJ5292234.1 hypothetical protein N7478_001485 [Penicillium angulare]
MTLSGICNQHLLGMKDMEQNDVPSKSMTEKKRLPLLMECLAAVSPKSPSHVQDGRAPSKSTISKEPVHGTDLSEPEKEDPVDWDFWPTSDTLSRESP